MSEPEELTAEEYTALERALEEAEKRVWRFHQGLFCNISNGHVIWKLGAQSSLLGRRLRSLPSRWRTKQTPRNSEVSC